MMLTGGMEAAVGKSIGLVGVDMMAATAGGNSGGGAAATGEDFCPGQVPA
jgi:hypothetical protein